MTQLAALAISAALSVGIILAISPLLDRYALARPNARSSHRIPTPQGGGIAIVAAVLCVTIAVIVWFPMPGVWSTFAVLAGASVALAGIGAYDDMTPLPVAPRLVMQVIVVAVLLVATGSGIRLMPPEVPLWLEWSLATLAGVWFVNLVNFMDGLDWVTVAEMVPVSGAIALFGAAGIVDPLVTIVATTLCGALIGFAWFNKPVARLFLGDVGSLPIGLIVAWLLFMLAGAGNLVAALLLPLYYCADATLTLGRRALRRERIWDAHRTHFYQRATDNGFSALAVSAHLLAVNVILAALATATVFRPSPELDVAAMLAGGAIVFWCMRRFTQPYPKRGMA
jgi:UDP-N-acetylmuramyl pentapeptide phosphotransferase/UDP-N-acetylglucosamine-1-phosphate transferase